MPRLTGKKKWEAVRTAALSLPGSWEDVPWEEDAVAKVNKKIFVFLGRPDTDVPRITVKLTQSHGHAMSVAGAAPSGYGLGKHGWVMVPIARVDHELLVDWVEESYRNVAPKRLIAELDRR
jgi:predicted DNA-binding protein (MmcQ/YjbR family)